MFLGAFFFDHMSETKTFGENGGFLRGILVKSQRKWSLSWENGGFRSGDLCNVFLCFYLSSWYYIVLVFYLSSWYYISSCLALSCLGCLALSCLVSLVTKHSDVHLQMILDVSRNIEDEQAGNHRERESRHSARTLQHHFARVPVCRMPCMHGVVSLPFARNRDGGGHV